MWNRNGDAADIFNELAENKFGLGGMVRRTMLMLIVAVRVGNHGTSIRLRGVVMKSASNDRKGESEVEKDQEAMEAYLNTIRPVSHNRGLYTSNHKNVNYREPGKLFLVLGSFG